MNIDSWFVTGVAEGEGAFTYISGGTPVFSLRQRSDYADTVEAVAGYFNVGTVYSCAARGPSQPNTYFRVCRLNELSVVIQHFDRFPLRSHRKQQAYAAWKDVVAFKQRGVGYGRKHRAELVGLLAALSALNCRGRRS